MVTRRKFLTTHAAAVATSALGLHVPAFGAVADNGLETLVPEDQLPRPHREFW
ncbi:MAG: twin-arginine translocation signal domain-containing protein, partial [Limisphaerales bacterium]